MKLSLCSLPCVLLCALSLQGQNHRKYMSPPPEFFRANNVSGSTIIGPGDVLAIRFLYSPEMNQTVTVRQDGKIALDLAQGLEVGGKTPEEVQKDLVAIYSHEFKDPVIAVQLNASASNSVYVTGEVHLPGVQPLRGRMTVAMVLAACQVNQKTAGSKSVFLIRSMGNDKFNAYKLNASFPNGRDRGIYLMPGDILFVPRKAIVKADDFIDLYVKELLPATPNVSADVLFTPGNPTSIASAAAVP